VALVAALVCLGKEQAVPMVVKVDQVELTAPHHLQVHLAALADCTAAAAAGMAHAVQARVVRAGRVPFVLYGPDAQDLFPQLM
jgi:hypothetical protein